MVANRLSFSLVRCSGVGQNSSLTIQNESELLAKFTAELGEVNCRFEMSFGLLILIASLIGEAQIFQNGPAIGWLATEFAIRTFRTAVLAGAK